MKCLCRIVFFLTAIIFQSILFTNVHVEASEIVATNSYVDFSNQVVWRIDIYDNGGVDLEYKYGLRKVDVYFCRKGEECDDNRYSHQSVMESSLEEPYKNVGVENAKYDFSINFSSGGEYRIRVEAYFGNSSAYSGSESVDGGVFTITQKQVVDTNDKYVSVNTNGVKDKRISGMLDDIQFIVNTVIIPIIYVVTTVFLVIKGTLLGMDIVKSADNYSVRKEKVGALKWLLIGVTITYAATSVVAFLTGFFKDFFK